MTRNGDAAERRAVRKYLATGEQPTDGYALITRAFPQRTFVIAKDRAGAILWAFFIGKAGHLCALDETYLIALENEEAKRQMTHTK